MSEGKKMADIVDAMRSDTGERLRAFSLQARAWRIVAMIAMTDSKRAAGYARWLFMETLPFVNEENVTKFIKDNEERAKKAGIEAGVFDK